MALREFESNVRRSILFSLLANDESRTLVIPFCFLTGTVENFEFIINLTFKTGLKFK